MMKRSSSVILAGYVISVGAVIASCSFPTYNITVSGGTGGASTSSSSVGSVGGGGASGTASSSSGGVGGAPSTTSSTGASSTSGSSSSTGSGLPCVSDGGPCDCDNDKALALSCGTGIDCNDDNPLVHPKQAMFFKDKIAGSVNDYDYDCDGVQKYEVEGVLDCTNPAACDTMTQRWKTKVPACGEVGQIGTCLIPALLQCAEKLQGMQAQRCH